MQSFDGEYYLDNLNKLINSAFSRKQRLYQKMVRYRTSIIGEGTWEWGKARESEHVKLTVRVLPVQEAIQPSHSQ